MKKVLLLVFVPIVATILATQIFSKIVKAVPGQWSANGNSVFYTDGFVGIGTSTPISKLAITSGTDSALNSIALNIATVEGRGWEFWTGKYLDPAKGSYSLTIAQPAYDGCAGCVGDLMFKPGRNVIVARGNVGIGTSNPTHKLSVNGTIRAKEILVNTGWADYVFEDDYELMSFAELSEFIAKNKHLPGVPDATEVEKNGVSLGEMSKIQMEKIEELTLYILELEERIEELENN